MGALMNLTAEIYRAQLNQLLHWSWMLRGRFKIEQIFLMHILSLWNAVYDAWEWFRDYPSLQFHRVKLHIALSRFSWKNRKRIDTLHGAASSLRCPVHASEKPPLYNGNYLEERDITCCPKAHHQVGLLMFHFLSKCRLRETSRTYESGLARSCEQDPLR